MHSDAVTERWYGVVANEILRLPYGQSNETEIENLALEGMAMMDQPLPEAVPHPSHSPTLLPFCAVACSCSRKRRHVIVGRDLTSQPPS